MCSDTQFIFYLLKSALLQSKNSQICFVVIVFPAQKVRFPLLEMCGTAKLLILVLFVALPGAAELAAFPLPLPSTEGDGSSSAVLPFENTRLLRWVATSPPNTSNRSLLIVLCIIARGYRNKHTENTLKKPSRKHSKEKARNWYMTRTIFGNAQYTATTTNQHTLQKVRKSPMLYAVLH
jgi:hypothetical protein